MKSFFLLPLAAFALPDEDFAYYAKLAKVDLSNFTEPELNEWRSHFSRLMSHEKDLSEQNIIKVFEDAEPMVTTARSKLLSATKKTWEHHESPRFRGWSIRDTKKLMGTFLTGEYAKKLPRTYVPTMEPKDLPSSFDVKKAFPECADISGHIRDQATCGSCWAFGSTEAFNDRKCIASNGKFKKLLSTQHTASCCGVRACFSFGCDGGNPSFAWDWLVHDGVVTGGDNDDEGKSDTCWPYELEKCAHHVDSPDLKPCNGDSDTPRCRKHCFNTKYSNPFEQDKVTGAHSFNIEGINSIKENLVKYGSVTAAFSVYDDFPNYKSGVYTRTPGSKMLGGHAIKVVGYGNEDGMDYWLVNNSWNEEWGDNGHFKIKMGECGIEGQVSAGTFEGQEVLTKGAEDADEEAIVI